MREIRLSASAIGDWKACPLRYQFGWLFKLEQDKEKDSLRIGEVYHRVHEIINMKLGDICPDCQRQQEIWPQCPLCNGKGILPQDLMESVIRYLDKRYENIPEGKTYDDWRVEQLTILHSLVGYQWHYGLENPFETIASEVWFDLPIVDGPKKMSKTRFVGKIDELVRDKQSGLVYVFERKSTSQSLDSGQYWNRLKLDGQITGYLYAARICQQLGKFEKLGVSKNDSLIQGVFYDVWHKPDIKPRKLTSVTWLETQETLEYCGQHFEPEQLQEFETPEMYASRLSADICERPEHYFARREIPRTDPQLAKFETELVKLVKSIRYTDKNNLWYGHDRACETPFYCEFCQLCYQQTQVGPEDIPQGYRKKNDNKTQIKTNR